MGLNWERNAHYFIKSNVKRHYHDLVINQLGTDNIPISKYQTNVTLYYKNACCDPWNIIPMIIKYLLDALQECNVLINDNSKFDCGAVINPHILDKENPRCEIEIVQVKDSK